LPLCALIPRHFRNQRLGTRRIIGVSLRNIVSRWSFRSSSDCLAVTLEFDAFCGNLPPPCPPKCLGWIKRSGKVFSKNLEPPRYKRVEFPFKLIPRPARCFVVARPL
jgi:hypothetical protein